MLQFLRNERARRATVAVALLAATGLVLLAKETDSFGEAALILLWVAVVVAVIFGLLAWREARNPTPSFRNQAVAVLDPNEEIRHVTGCVYRYEPPPAPAFVEWLERAEEAVGSLGNYSGGHGTPLIVCITNRRLAVINPFVRVFRTRGPTMRWHTEPLSIERAEIGEDIMNHVPMTTVELVVSKSASRPDRNTPMPPGHHVFGFVNTPDADSMMVAVTEWLLACS